MLHVENSNRDILNFLSAKLEIDNQYLFKSLPKKDKNGGPGFITDSLTLGTERNEKVLIGSLAPAGGFITVGLGKVLLGLVSFAPAAGEAHGTEVVRFFENARNFGEATVNSGYSNLETGVYLLAIPAGVTAISLSVKLYRMLVDNKKQKIANNNLVIKLIDDILEQKENDPSLDFATTFFKKVDLSENKEKANLKLLEHLAFHRTLLMLKEQGKVSDEDVSEEYFNMMKYIKEMKESKNASENFKHNRYLGILIDEYDEKLKERMILSGIPLR